MLQATTYVRPFWAAVLALAVAPGSALAQQDCSAPRHAIPFLPALTDSGRIFRGTFSPDGSEFYYFRKMDPDGRGEDYRIFVVRREGASWSAPSRVHLGGEYSDLYPAVTPDNQGLVFSSYRRAPGDTSATPNAGIWLARRRGSGWSDPEYLPQLNQRGRYHSGLNVGTGGRLTYRRISPDWTTSEAFQAGWNGRTFTAAALDTTLARWRDWNPAYHVWGGILAPDGSFALLDISPLDSAGRRGPAELWVSRRHPGGWSSPRLAGGGVNSPGTDNFFVFTPDGCELVFVRDFSAFYRVGVAAVLEE